MPRTLRALALASCLVPFLGAAERTLTYVNDSNVLAPGQREVELWSTLQGGREGRSYRRLDTRLELEFGIAPETQVALYLNHRRTSENGVADSEFEGVSLEWKRRLTQSAADGIGTAVYLEGTANASETELEAKAIADWSGGGWLVAANLVTEWEWAEEPNAGGTRAVTEEEQEIKLNVGIVRDLGPTWTIGVEAENRNPIHDGDWESSTLWAGPAVHWKNEHLWATLTVLPQLTNLGGEADAGSRELDDHSRIEGRLLIGANF